MGWASYEPCLNSPDGSDIGDDYGGCYGKGDTRSLGRRGPQVLRKGAAITTTMRLEHEIL